MSGCSNKPASDNGVMDHEKTPETNDVDNYLYGFNIEMNDDDTTSMTATSSTKSYSSRPVAPMLYHENKATNKPVSLNDVSNDNNNCSDDDNIRSHFYKCSDQLHKQRRQKRNSGKNKTVCIKNENSVELIDIEANHESFSTLNRSTSSFTEDDVIVDDKSIHNEPSGDFTKRKNQVENSSLRKWIQQLVLCCCVTSNQTTSLWIGAIGIYISFLMYGHEQEGLFLYRSPHDRAAFRYVWFLQVFESIATILFGYLAIIVLKQCGRYFHSSKKEELQQYNNTPATIDNKELPIHSLFMVGVIQALSRGMASLALATGVSFPVLTLAKSAKIIPVMLGQLFFTGSRYTIRDYMFCLFIVSGVTFVNLGEKQQRQHPNMNLDEDKDIVAVVGDPFDWISQTNMIGLLCLICSLCLDGCQAGLQKRMQEEKSNYRVPGMFDFLIYSQCSVLVVALVISSIITQEIIDAMFYIINNPPVQTMILKVCISAVFGQAFIFYVITKYDTLICTTITTTRKILSVVMSIISHGHVLSPLGYVGLLQSFVAIMLMDLRPNKAK